MLFVFSLFDLLDLPVFLLQNQIHFLLPLLVRLQHLCHHGLHELLMFFVHVRDLFFDLFLESGVRLRVDHLRSWRRKNFFMLDGRAFAFALESSRRSARYLQLCIMFRLQS